MYDACYGANIEGQELWVHFIFTFRLPAIDAWPKRFTYKCCNLHRSQGLHVDKGRETSCAEALKRLLFRK